MPAFLYIEYGPETFHSVDSAGLTSPGFPQYFPPSILPITGGAAFEVAQCNTSNFIFYCCDGDGSGECCNDPKNDLKLGRAEIAFIASSSAFSGAPGGAPGGAPTSTPIGTATTAAASSASSDNGRLTIQATSSSNSTADSTAVAASSQTALTPSSVANSTFPTPPTAPQITAPTHSNRHAVIIGASVGVSMATVILFVAILAWHWLRRRPAEHEDQEEDVQRADDTKSSTAAPQSESGFSTVLDSHSPPQRPVPNDSHYNYDAREQDSPTIRHFASFPLLSQPPQSPLSPQFLETYPLNPPAELESSFDVAPIHPRSPPPSRPPPPAPAELEARDGVTVSTLYRAASASSLPRKSVGSSSHLPRRPPTHGSPLSTILQSPHTSVMQKAEGGSVVEEPSGRDVLPGPARREREARLHTVAEALEASRSQQSPSPSSGSEARNWAHWL